MNTSRDMSDIIVLSEGAHSGGQNGGAPTKIAVAVPKAARMLDMSERKLRSMIRTGELRSFTIGRSRRVAMDEILAYIRRRQDDQSDAA